MKPTASADFDRAYSAPFTLWGDVRIPPELKTLIVDRAPRSCLELGCGVGRFSRYVAQQGLRSTAVDFSAIAIEKAKRRGAGDVNKPTFLVGDVTHLDGIEGPFDVSFDVGCFHCLDGSAQPAYVAEVARLLAPGGTHLIWALDSTPGDLTLSPEAVQEVFTPHFVLKSARASRRRLARSHWYWLTRSQG